MLPKEILLPGCADAYNLPHQLRIPTAVPGRTNNNGDPFHATFRATFEQTGKKCKLRQNLTVVSTFNVQTELYEQLPRPSPLPHHKLKILRHTCTIVPYTCVYLHCTVSYYEDYFYLHSSFLNTVQLWTFSDYKILPKPHHEQVFKCFIYVKQSDENTFQGINYRTSLEYYILSLRNTHTKATTLTTCPSPVITTCRLALTFKRPPACWQIRWDESIASRRYWYNVGAKASALPTYSWYYYATAQLFETQLHALNQPTQARCYTGRITSTREEQKAKCFVQVLRNY